MKLRLVVPGGGAPGEPASGGYRYDEALAAALRALGHDARVVAAPEPGAVHLFDGLGAAQWAPRLREVPGIKVALLHQPAGCLEALGADPGGAVGPRDAGEAAGETFGFDAATGEGAAASARGGGARLPGPRAAHQDGAAPRQPTRHDGAMHGAVAGRPGHPDGAARGAAGAQPSHHDGAAHRAEALLLEGCDAVQFVSARAEADTRARHATLPACWVAAPGVDHFTPLPPAPERRLVGNGHLWAGKGVLEALELVAALPGAWHLDWLGALDVDAEYAARVLERQRALGLERRVTFHGRVSQREVAAFLARAAACLTTSRYESWGLALAEALRAGVPVVGPTAAGVLELTGGLGARGGTWPTGLADPLALSALPAPGQPPRTASALAESRATGGHAGPRDETAVPRHLERAREVDPDWRTTTRAWLVHCLDDDATGRALREEARAAGALLPTWAECAATTVRHLEALCAR